MVLAQVSEALLIPAAAGGLVAVLLGLLWPSGNRS
jgi:hypothetical protein